MSEFLLMYIAAHITAGIVGMLVLTLMIAASVGIGYYLTAYTNV